MADIDFVVWTDKVVAHVADNDLTRDDVEHVFDDPDALPGFSRSTRRPSLRGWLPDGRFILIVYELEIVDGLKFAYPVTAYQIEP